MLKLNWDKLHRQSREDILAKACLTQKLKFYRWCEIDDWIKALISGSIETRSRSVVTILKEV